MEQGYNEYIDMTYLRKRYMNISPIGNSVSVTERQNLPYSILLGFTPPWNIIINTQCSGCGSSSILIKPQNSDSSHQKNN